MPLFFSKIMWGHRSFETVSDPTPRTVYVCLSFHCNALTKIVMSPIVMKYSPKFWVHK